MGWIFIGRVESMGFGYDEYTNEDNTKCRQVWDDGYEEIFDAWKPLLKDPKAVNDFNAIQDILDYTKKQSLL